MFRAWPPASVRPLLRRINLMTWLDPPDDATIVAIADKGFGLDSVAHVEVRCSVIKLVRAWFPRDVSGANAEADACRTPDQGEVRIWCIAGDISKHRICKLMLGWQGCVECSLSCVRFTAFGRRHAARARHASTRTRTFPLWVVAVVPCTKRCTAARSYLNDCLVRTSACGFSGMPIVTILTTTPACCR